MKIKEPEMPPHNAKAGLMVLLLALILTACQPSTLPPTATPVTEAPSDTPKPSPTATLTPSATPSPSPTASATPTLTPTSTLRWEDLALELTPLPSGGESISPENITEVVPMGIWGNGRANDLVLSPDGRILAVATGIGVFLYDSLTYARLALVPTPFPALTIAFTADSSQIAIAQSNGLVSIHGDENFEETARLNLAEFDLPKAYRVRLAFTDEEQLIAFLRTGQEAFVKVWERTTWNPLQSYEKTEALTSFLNPDTNTLGQLNGSSLTLNALLDPEDSLSQALPKGLEAAAWDRLSYYEGNLLSPQDGRYLLINTGAELARWDLQNDNLTYLIDNYPKYLPSGCAQAPDTCRNVNGGFGWDCPDGPGPPPIEMIALTPDEIMILVSLNEGRTEFRRSDNGALMWEINTHFTDVTFSPGGEFFFGVRPNGTIEKRATLDGSLMDFLEQHPSRLFSLAFSPDSTILAAGYSDGWIRIYSTENGQFLGVLTGLAWSLAFSPEGDLLAAGLSDGVVRIFRLEQGDYYDLPQPHLAPVTDLGFSPAGDHLLTGSQDCTAQLWDLKYRARIHSLNPGGDNPFQIAHVALLGSDPLQYFAGNRNGVFLFEGAAPLSHFLTMEYGFTDLALSPDGHWMALTGDGTYLLTPPQTNAVPEPVPLNDTHGYALAFSPNNDFLVLATIENLEFWSLAKSERLGELRIYEQSLPKAWPIALRLSPDGRVIAMATYDGLIRLFGLP
jgi:WD40 repeat protein